MANLCNRIKESLKRQRIEKIPTALRSKHFLIFIDFHKAFDNVNRKLLIQKLYEKGIPKPLIKAIGLLLLKSEVNINGIITPKQKGVV